MRIKNKKLKGTNAIYYDSKSTTITLHEFRIDLNSELFSVRYPLICDAKNKIMKVIRVL